MNFAAHITTPVHEGEILLGKYRVESILGMGGMGIVVCATHLKLQERVAIKMLLPTLVSHPPIVARFLQEARAAARLKSEHVARVTDFGTFEDGTPFLVMEYLDGADLEGVLRACGHFEVEEAIDYVLQVAEALAEAHRMGIVHRDLKPENLFLTEGADGAALVKVLDFGISKIESNESSVSQSPDEILGSPAYMAPEQFQDSRSASVRSDVWALGVLLYEFLTGKLPFDGSTLHAIMAAVTTREPAPLTAHRSDLPPELSEAVLECLRKDPEQRPQNVLAVADLLAPFVSETVRSRVARVAAISRKTRPSMHSIPSRTPAGVRSLSGIRLSEAPPSSVSSASSLASESSPLPSDWSRTPVGLTTSESPSAASSPSSSWRSRIRARATWLALFSAVGVASVALQVSRQEPLAEVRAKASASGQGSDYEEAALETRTFEDPPAAPVHAHVHVRRTTSISAATSTSTSTSTPTPTPTSTSTSTSTPNALPAVPPAVRERI